MIPWDLGLIKALQNLLGYTVLPSENSEIQTPYLVFELTKYEKRAFGWVRVDFELRIVPNNDWYNDRFDIADNIEKKIAKSFDLYSDEGKIGETLVKTNFIESRKNHLILSLSATVRLESGV